MCMCMQQFAILHNSKNIFGVLLKHEFKGFIYLNRCWLKMDDPFVSCPYVAAHRVPLSRLQGHIVKCQKKYPELAICPYNATHRFSEAEIREHVMNCPARAEVFPDIKPEKTGALTTPKPILQRDYLPETDPRHEIWDD